MQLHKLLSWEGILFSLKLQSEKSLTCTIHSTADHFKLFFNKQNNSDLLQLVYIISWLWKRYIVKDLVRVSKGLDHSSCFKARVILAKSNLEGF